MSDWAALLAAVRRVHEATPTLSDFCPFPEDLRDTPFNVADHPASQAFRAEDFGATPYSEVVDAMHRVAPLAHWRRTYADTNIGADFMSRFGCFALIGPEAPFQSQSMQAFFVYMPRHLWYPWHHHLADEVYFVLAGGGLFLKSGAAPIALKPGQTAYHAPSQPHALETTDDPVLAYVLWRSHFDSPPELTPEGAY